MTTPKQVIHYASNDMNRTQCGLVGVQATTNWQRVTCVDCITDDAEAEYGIKP